MRHRITIAGAVVAGVFGTASSAGAAPSINCDPPGPSGWTCDKIDFSATPDPWTNAMQGKTVTVTVTNKTDAKVPLGLLSYKAQSEFVLLSFPQTLHQSKFVDLNARETVTLSVDVPNCYYQVDFIDASDLQQVEIDTAFLGHRVLHYANGGDSIDCNRVVNPPPPGPENPPVTPGPNDPQNPYTPPALPPVNGGSVAGQDTPNPPAPPKPVVRACSAVKATSYRVRAKQRNTITVRVTTTATTKPKVTLRGAGVSTSKRVASDNRAVFRVTPKRGGSIRVTASGCTKVAAVKVLSAKRTRQAVPRFTG